MTVQKAPFRALLFSAHRLRLLWRLWTRPLQGGPPGHQSTGLCAKQTRFVLFRCSIPWSIKAPLAMVPLLLLLERWVLAGLGRSTISRVWKGARVTRATGIIHSPEFSRKLSARGRRPKFSPSTIRSRVKALPLMARNTRQNLSLALKVSHTTVNSWVKEGILQSHRNMLKPTLTEQNKLSCLLMATSFIKEKEGKEGEYEYKDMYDLVHVDEKWFYLSQDRQRFVLTDDEKNPHRSVKHKSHVTKVMFLCAIARPRFIPYLNKWWDGKIGIWPIGEWVPAKRDSANRPKGTPVWKNTSITRDVYRALLVEKVLPGIIEK